MPFLVRHHDSVLLWETAPERQESKSPYEFVISCNGDLSTCAIEAYAISSERSLFPSSEKAHPIRMPFFRVVRVVSIKSKTIPPLAALGFCPITQNPRSSKA